ncbi:MULTISPECIES: magnesium transporter [Aestuariibaculum]|uniref:Magnesium transporter MgtE n=1 Tax=Aestuariibaculum lutulentum TaxID=2920935 RepID=A0ABS9RHC2_9FLAO|nr:MULTISPECIES: magnesium transporter [Aestuariibaculum]MCH4552339.1 magnesium transporter [Aestuariibaculum lutulentum]MCR8667442.1 magnesium transporter [Aestuariibaculum sp. M13]
MAEETENIQFELTDDLVNQVESLIRLNRDKDLKNLLDDFHYADIAEILDELDLEEAMYVIKLLDSETTADILMELDEDNREKVLRNLSTKEIAEEIAELDTDDAADIIAELPEERRQEVISQIEDEDHKAEITELLKYDEDSAGGLMAKELVKVYDTWTVAGCLRRLRGQAKEVTRVHSVYVVDKQEKLVGRLSLKDLIVAKNEQKIADIYISSVDYVNVNDDAEDVARVMQKYDLEAIPVVDDDMKLLGRITIDDIVDVMKEEAERDYQLAAGISQDVEADDSIFELTKARLPWLLIGMFGGLGAAAIITVFQSAISDLTKISDLTLMKELAMLTSFVPLIQATAGNVGVQSSAIVVQGLANDTIDGKIFKRLFKEFLLGLINGLGIALIVLPITHFLFDTPYLVSTTICIALIAVIVIAALIGTFIPIFLDKRGIDPAVATGPFITTSNDIFGILIYFSIAKLILGF